MKIPCRRKTADTATDYDYISNIVDHCLLAHVAGRHRSLQPDRSRGFDKTPNIVDRCIFQHAVPEVENVPFMIPRTYARSYGFFDFVFGAVL